MDALRFNPLINRNFALLAIGYFTSLCGDSIHQVALIWWLYNVTGSPGTTGLLTMAAMIPALVLGPYLGVLADRLDRRRIVYSMDFCRAAVIGAIALLAFYGRLRIWHVVLSSVLIGIISSFFSPACSALIPQLVGVENLQRAQSVTQAFGGMVGIFGPVIGGLLVSSFGYATAFLVNAIALMLSGISEVFIRCGYMPLDNEADGWKALKKAVDFTFGTPTIIGILLVFGLMNFALAPLSSVTVPYIIKDRLGKTATELGLVMTFLSIGSITGSVMMGTMKNPRRRSPMIVLAGIGIGLALISWIMIPTLWWFYAISVVSGFMMVIITINAGVLLLSHTPDNMRGKMTAFTHFITSLLSPISLALFSLVARANMDLVFYFPAVTGLLIMSASLFLLKVRGFKQL